MNALCEMMNSFGVICSFLLGSRLQCMDQAIVPLIPLAAFMGIMFILPDTPEYWISKNDKQRAIESNQFYKGSNATLNSPNEKDYYLLPQNKDDLKKAEENSSSKIEFSDFCE